MTMMAPVRWPTASAPPPQSPRPSRPGLALGRDSGRTARGPGAPARGGCRPETARWPQTRRSRSCCGSASSRSRARASATRRTAPTVRPRADRHLHGARAANQLEHLVDRGARRSRCRRTSRHADWRAAERLGNPDRFHGARSWQSRSAAWRASANRVGDAHDRATISRTRVHADDVRAGSTAAVTAAAVRPVAIVRRRGRRWPRQKRLARRADEQRAAERGQRRQPRQQRQAVLGPLGKAEARDRRSAVARHAACDRARSTLASSSRRHLVDDVAVVGLRDTCRATARGCASG